VPGCLISGQANTIVVVRNDEYGAGGIWKRHIKQRIKNRPDRQKQLEAILESVVPYKYGYATKPEQWHSARKGLYDLARGLK